MQDVAAGVTMREVTDEEVAFYQANGWVKLERLIEPELAAEMLEIARREMENADVELRTEQAMDSKVHDRAYWRDWHFPGRDHGIEPFRSLAYSPSTGRNARLFMGREVSVNYHADMLAVKMPEGHTASAPTGFHQDWVNFPFDRVGFLTFWIALAPITPEMGTMRFLSGSHQEGPLGKMGLISGKELTEYYPDLESRRPMSPPLTLRAGDATVHNGMVVHGAPANSTDKPRWVFLCSYHPSDTCYTGAPHHIFRSDMGLEVGEPIAHEKFRVVHHGR